MNSNSIACPLDCYDACEATFIDEKIKGSQTHFTTRGKLCRNFAHLLSQKRLTTSFFNNQEITLQKSKDILKQKLKQTNPSKVLYYSGSGNLGVMQNSTKDFFSKHNAVSTKGSLCDDIGRMGLELGRGFFVNPPLENLLKSDVIVVWGRNLTVTSSHIYQLIKDKTFITIDPIVTKIAQKSQIHLQINPKTDYELALLLTRFAYMQDLEDEERLKEFSTGFEDFLELANERSLLSYEKTIGVALKEVSEVIDLLKDKNVSFLVGLGVQKYFEGAQIMRTIDSFASYIGVNTKDQGGVWYLGDSTYKIESPFQKNFKEEVPIAQVDFSSYDLVFIQGANPVISSVYKKGVVTGLEKTFVVYFGTTYNDTCDFADLIIPSSNFLSKKDIRLSYGHEYKALSTKVEQKDEKTITEYELAQYLNKEFGYESLQSEDEIINHYKNHTSIVPIIEKFEFISEIDIENLYEQKEDDELFFITAKQKDSLNSQFKTDDRVYLHPNKNFKENDLITVSSKYGKAKFRVKIDEKVKQNCLLIYSGAKDANFLTPNISDEVANSAIYQEIVVKIELS